MVKWQRGTHRTSPGCGLPRLKGTVHCGKLNISTEVDIETWKRFFTNLLGFWCKEGTCQLRTLQHCKERESKDCKMVTLEATSFMKSFTCMYYSNIIQHYSKTLFWTRCILLHEYNKCINKVHYIVIVNENPIFSNYFCEWKQTPSPVFIIQWFWSCRVGL